MVCMWARYLILDGGSPEETDEKENKEKLHDIFLIFKSNICTEFIVHRARIQVTSPHNVRPNHELFLGRMEKGYAIDLEKDRERARDREEQWVGYQCGIQRGK